MNPPEDQARTWTAQQTEALLRVVDHLPDVDLAGPSALPGWTRTHLLVHLGFNAEALRRLLAWARSGVRTPMYPSKEHRDAEIAEGGQWEPERVRAFLHDTADALAADLADLPASALDAELVNAQGRPIPARVVPWMRAKEVAVHAVDLDAGITFADLPDDLCAALVDDVAALRSSRGDGPALLLHSDGRTFRVEGSGAPVEVRAPAWQLAQWLCGRGHAGLVDVDGRPAPTLAAWL